MALPLVIPIVLLASVLLFFFSGQNPIYRQQRPGFEGKPFVLYKLRTLFPDQMGKLHWAVRLGSLLRSYSIDELPQLYNVIKGDMSVVGPRPLLMEYLPLYNDHQKKRHHCKPGITGWAQINGRNLVEWPDRFEMDVWYVNNQSLRLDIKIILCTFYGLPDKRKVKPEGLKEHEKFKGNL
jgi:sugar transferase EpsL